MRGEKKVDSLQKCWLLIDVFTMIPFSGHIPDPKKSCYSKGITRLSFI